MFLNLDIKHTIAKGILFAFLINSFGLIPLAQSQEFYLPAPGQMVALSPSFSPAVLKGIQLDPKNPFRFHFFVDQGDRKLKQEDLKVESSRLIKYFLASLTIPEKDLWVNLSPYEKDRIVPQEFGQTEMGRDLLAQDYMLKQITASLIYPEDKIGKEFWKTVYAQAQAKYGTTNIPINTFNKVWIVPDKAVVYENKGTAFVLENHLKVMLEEDYLSLLKHGTQRAKTSSIGTNIVREIVIPALTKEVNEGRNFSQLRQVFYSLILATWYKKKIKDSILNKIYSNRSKINGVGYKNMSSSNALIGDPQRIYQQYLQAFKKGVFNYIKEDVTTDPQTKKQGIFPRKYFSGGVVGQYDLSNTRFIGLKEVSKKDFAQLGSSIEKVDVRISLDRGMTGRLPDERELPYGQEGPYSHPAMGQVSIFYTYLRSSLRNLDKLTKVNFPDNGKNQHIVLIGPGTDAGDLRGLLKKCPQARQIDVIDPIDISKEIEQIKKEYQGGSMPQINFIQKNVLDMQNEIQNADIVLAFHVFAVHYFEPESLSKINQKIYAMLKVGGSFALSYDANSDDFGYSDAWIKKGFQIFRLTLSEKYDSGFALAVKQDSYVENISSPTFVPSDRAMQIPPAKTVSEVVGRLIAKDPRSTFAGEWVAFAKLMDRYGVKPGDKVLDLGAGYNGIAGFLLGIFGCQVDDVDPDYTRMSDYEYSVEKYGEEFYGEDKASYEAYLKRVHYHPAGIHEHLQRNKGSKYDVVIAANVLDYLLNNDLLDDIGALWSSVHEGTVMFVSMLDNDMVEIKDLALKNGVQLEIEPIKDPIDRIASRYGYMVRVLSVKDQAMLHENRVEAKRLVLDALYLKLMSPAENKGPYRRAIGDFWVLFNATDLYSDQLIKLIANFRNVPGIERVISNLFGQHKSEQLIRGTFETLYHAFLFEKEGYKILGFNLLINSNNRSFLEIDTLASKENEYYFIEAHHTRQIVIPKPEDIGNKIRLGTAENKFQKYGKLVRDLKERGENSPFAAQIRKMVGTEIAEDLIRMIRRVGHKPRVVLSNSLTFPIGTPSKYINDYMLRLASLPDFFMDCFSEGIKPVTIIRLFNNDYEATDKIITVSGEIEKKVLNTTYVPDLKDEIEKLLASSYFVLVKAKYVDGSIKIIVNNEEVLKITTDQQGRSFLVLHENERFKQPVDFDLAKIKEMEVSFLRRPKPQAVVNVAVDKKNGPVLYTTVQGFEHAIFSAQSVDGLEDIITQIRHSSLTKKQRIELEGLAFNRLNSMPADAAMRASNAAALDGAEYVDRLRETLGDDFYGGAVLGREDLRASVYIAEHRVRASEKFLSIGPGGDVIALATAASLGARVDVNQPEFYIGPEGKFPQKHLDILEQLIQKMPQHIKLNIHIRFPQAIQESNIPKSTYDWILLLNVLDGVSAKEAREIAARAVDALKNGGRIVFSTNSPLSMPDAYVDLISYAQRKNFLKQKLEKVSDNVWVLTLHKSHADAAMKAELSPEVLRLWNGETEPVWGKTLDPKSYRELFIYAEQLIRDMGGSMQADTKWGSGLPSARAFSILHRAILNFVKEAHPDLWKKESPLLMEFLKRRNDPHWKGELLTPDEEKQLEELGFQIISAQLMAWMETTFYFRSIGHLAGINPFVQVMDEFYYILGEKKEQAYRMFNITIRQLAMSTEEDHPGLALLLVRNKVLSPEEAKDFTLTIRQDKDLDLDVKREGTHFEMKYSVFMDHTMRGDIDGLAALFVVDAAMNGNEMPDLQIMPVTGVHHVDPVQFSSGTAQQRADIIKDYILSNPPMIKLIDDNRFRLRLLSTKPHYMIKVAENGGLGLSFLLGEVADWGSDGQTYTIGQDLEGRTELSPTDVASLPLIGQRDGKKTSIGALLQAHGINDFRQRGLPLERSLTVCASADGEVFVYKSEDDIMTSISLERKGGFWESSGTGQFFGQKPPGGYKTLYMLHYHPEFLQDDIDDPYPSAEDLQTMMDSDVPSVISAEGGETRVWVIKDRDALRALMQRPGFKRGMLIPGAKEVVARDYLVSASFNLADAARQQAFQELDKIIPEASKLLAPLAAPSANPVDKLNQLLRQLISIKHFVGYVPTEKYLMEDINGINNTEKPFEWFFHDEQVSISMQSKTNDLTRPDLSVGTVEEEWGQLYDSFFHLQDRLALMGAFKDGTSIAQTKTLWAQHKGELGFKDPVARAEITSWITYALFVQDKKSLFYRYVFKAVAERVSGILDEFEKTLPAAREYLEARYGKTQLDLAAVERSVDKQRAVRFTPERIGQIRQLIGKVKESLDRYKNALPKVFFESDKEYREVAMKMSQRNFIEREIRLLKNSPSSISPEILPYLNRQLEDPSLALDVRAVSLENASALFHSLFMDLVRRLDFFVGTTTGSSATKMLEVLEKIKLELEILSTSKDPQALEAAAEKTGGDELKRDAGKLIEANAIVPGFTQAVSRFNDEFLPLYQELRDLLDINHAMSAPSESDGIDSIDWESALVRMRQIASQENTLEAPAILEKLNRINPPGEYGKLIREAYWSGRLSRMQEIASQKDVSEARTILGELDRTLLVVGDYWKRIKDAYWAGRFRRIKQAIREKDLSEAKEIYDESNKAIDSFEFKTQIRNAYLYATLGEEKQERPRKHFKMPLDFYAKILGVQPGDSLEKIKSKYRKLAVKYHPDKNPGDKAAEAKMKEINEAYEALTDRAMNAHAGGIDLNPAQMSMQVKEEGEDFKFDFNGTTIDAAQVTGATFTILQITPVTDLLLILGI